MGRALDARVVFALGGTLVPVLLLGLVLLLLDALFDTSIALRRRS